MRLLLALALVGASLATLDIPAGLRITLADRTVDVSSQIVKNNIALTFTNGGEKEVNTVFFVVPSKEDQHIAFISATEDKKDSKLRVSKAPGANAGFQAYKIELLSRVAKGQTVKIVVDYFLTHFLTPYPAEIEQSENQFVLYEGDAHVVSVYPVDKEQTWVKLAEGKVHSFTNVAPSKQDGQKIIYGPYTDQKPYTTAAIKVHSENNSPFVVATEVERLIEVSHWGNIAVEESIELVHQGAKLKGPFSRLDLQMDRRPRMPALKSYTTVLPASARDVYYRDEIGNISTSALRQRSDRIDLEIRPRFPLFGGWRTTYILGYNLPAYEYLFSKGNQYQLKLRLLDHIFDNSVVEKLTVRIILPELSKNVKIVTPYSTARKPDEIKATYLDTAGRTVVVLEKENLVPAHIQTFTLTYEFEWSNIIREPIIATAFFFALFIAVIVYVRFDFSIVTDKARDQHEKVQGKLQEVSELVLKRFRLHESIANAVTKFKENRDVGALQAAKKKTDDERAALVSAINGFVSQLKSDGNDISEKVVELNKIEKSLEEAETAYLQSVQSQRAGLKTSTEDRLHQEKVHNAQGRVKSLINTF